MSDLPEELARRIKQRVRLHLDSAASRSADEGLPLRLSGAAADEVARIAGEVLLGAGRDEEMERLRADLAKAEDIISGVANMDLDEGEAERAELIAENEYLRLTFQRLDVLHHPRLGNRIEPCEAHTGAMPTRAVLRCSECKRVPEVVCSDIRCCTWPCEAHLALHGEAEESCTHREPSAGEPAEPEVETAANRPSVRLDPAQNFGEPALLPGGPKVADVLGLLDAGEPLGVVCEELGVTRAGVLLACWFEARHGTGPHPRDEWLDWLEQWGPSLWRTEYDKVPMPPFKRSPTAAPVAEGGHT